MIDISFLADKALANQSRAFSILGAEPGPGIDIIFLPDIPVAYFYSVKVLTLAGAGFIRVLYNGQGRIASRDLTRMKKELADFGLSFHTEWGHVVEIVE